MNGVIPLSPIDHVFTGVGSYPIEFVFAYPGAIDADRLAESLRSVLALFPAVSSRLVRLPGDVYGLEPTPDGCVFETATADATFTSAAALAAPVETIEGQPLARVRLTRTPEGSLLAVSISHAVVDGFSYFYFLSAWSRVFHGQPVPPPCHDRQLLAATGTPSPPDADAVRDDCGLFLDTRRPALDRARLRWTRHVFSREELHALVSEAQAGCPLRLSHNDVVSAWLWRTHAAGWSDPGEPPPVPLSWLSCPVDVRRALALPPTYVGCAVVLATAAIERERLATAPLAELARAVRDAVAAVDDARTRRSLGTIDALRRRHGLGVLERLHVVHPRTGLLVTNLSRLPVREIVFDAGPPVGFEMPAPAERCAVILPAEGGLDVRVCAPAAPAGA
jgi:hypothetical protein